MLECVSLHQIIFDADWNQAPENEDKSSQKCGWLYLSAIYGHLAFGKLIQMRRTCTPRKSKQGRRRGRQRGRSNAVFPVAGFEPLGCIRSKYGCGISTDSSPEHVLTAAVQAHTDGRDLVPNYVACLNTSTTTTPGLGVGSILGGKIGRIFFSEDGRLAPSSPARTML